MAISFGRKDSNELVQQEIPYGHSYLIKIKVPRGWSTDIVEKELKSGLHIVTFTNSSSTIKFDIFKNSNVKFRTGSTAEEGLFAALRGCKVHLIYKFLVMRK